jgi:hypothetical protein
MHLDVLIAAIRMILPSFYWDIFSACTQFTAKSVLSFLVIRTGVLVY